MLLQSTERFWPLLALAMVKKSTSGDQYGTRILVKTKQFFLFKHLALIVI